TDPGVFPNSATDTDTQSSSADLGITKTDGSPTYTPGAGLTYTIVATNHGPSNVTDATVSDSFDASLGTPSWSATGSAGTSGFDALGTGNISDSGITIPSGGSVTYTVTATVSSSRTGNLVNTATVSSAVSDPGVFPNSATDTDTQSSSADLGITKPATSQTYPLTPTVSSSRTGNLLNPAPVSSAVSDPGVFPNSATDTDTQSSSADLGITKTDGSPTYTPGAGLTYTIVATNHGPSNVTDATVSDSFDPSLRTPTWTAAGPAGPPVHG